jgi:peptidoglycan hydrolase-like protein with peptidoglycan-binding domain
MTLASMWLPGATIYKAGSDAGSMLGGAKKVVWHSTENDPNKASALSVAKYLKNSAHYEVHLVWNPVTGEIVQMIPANRGAKGLKNSSGGVQTNRGGTYVIQIEVVGQATKPFTDGPCKNLDKILSWLNGLGIPATWPAGQPKAYPAAYGGTRSTSAWAKGGHFSHGQVPENVHGDPGHVDIKKLTNYGHVAAPVVKKGDPVLKMGSTGTAVKNVQHGFNIISPKTHLVEDGNFGAGTAGVVKAFQKKHGFAQNGVFDQPCWDALRRSIMNVREGKPA